MINASLLINAGLNTWQATSDYNTAREQGDSKAVALAKGVGSAALWEFLGPYALPIAGVQIATQVAPALIQAGSATKMEGNKAVYNNAGKFGSGYFNMTEAGYTMRQRSLNAIRNNGLNMNSVLGNEARTYFRSTT